MLLSEGKRKGTRRRGYQDSDWAVCLVRWGLIAGIPVVTLIDPAKSLSPANLALILILASVYNVVVSLLLVVRYFPRIAQVVTLVADTAGIAVLLHVHLAQKK